MRARAARITLGAVVCLAILGSAAFLILSERRLAAERGALDSFDQHAHDVAATLGDLRAAQQAYVAEGQGVAYWMPKVTGLSGSASESLTALAALATPAGRTSIEQASSALAEFAGVDKRARDYIKSAQPLMAGDVIFTEGGQTTAAAGQLVEMARLAEHDAFNGREAASRRLEAAVLAAAGLLSLLGVAILVPGAAADDVSPAAEDRTRLITEHPASDTEFARVIPRQTPPAAPAQARTSAMSARPVSPILKAAADLCTEIGRVNTTDELTGLLSRASSLLDASGLIVWIGGAGGTELRPVLAHGYSTQTLSRMPSVPKAADNAAAAAYRSGTVQIVLAKPGSSTPGAIVAPLLGPDGCIGALSAEITGGGEGSDAVQALATLFAAQLTSVLVAPAPPVENRAATG